MIQQNLFGLPVKYVKVDSEEIYSYQPIVDTFFEICAWSKWLYLDDNENVTGVQKKRIRYHKKTCPA